MISFYKIGLNISKFLGDIRNQENKIIYSYLRGCGKILDVGAGSGTFIKLAPSKISGIEFNNENVEFCNSIGLNVKQGDARNLDVPDNYYDGVVLSHVLQIFGTNDGLKCLKELFRVTKPNGLIVISTLNWFPRFFRHIENTKAWPPEAIRSLNAGINGSSSPSFNGLPKFSQENIWFRRSPLFDLYSSRNHNLNRFFGIMNKLQYRLFLRKYWSFHSYIICLKKISE